MLTLDIFPHSQYNGIVSKQTLVKHLSLPSSQKKYISECIGTFILVFFGTGAIIFDEFSAGGVTHVGVSLVFGLTVMLVIYAVGDISGAHLNPAVSLGFFAAGKAGLKDTSFYILFQMLGAVFASLVLKIAFSGNDLLGTTMPATGISFFSAFLLEFIMTLVLMYIILNVSTGAKEKGIIAGITVGAVIGVEALLGGPITGASMNPARSFAPALVSGNYQALWIYILAPITGALAGVFVFRKGR